MAARKKKRTSIRTAAGTAQERFLERLRALRDDPTRVLPEVIGPEPKPLAKVRAGIEKAATGRPGFAAKRDKGVVGAVVQSMPLAELEAVPRLVDHKVGGRRRFYLMRGQVERSAMLGVQNHDDPLVLLMAYRAMAKKHGLHFFATDRLVCSGAEAHPPAAWWDQVGAKAGVAWEDHGIRTCPHPHDDLVRVGFPGGPHGAVCGRCAPEGLHASMKQRFAGPHERRPFEVRVLRGGVDGEAMEVERELLASYRAGVADERTVIRQTLAQWREAAEGVRFNLGAKEYDSHDAFLDALGAEGWLRDAAKAMTRHGHQGPSEGLPAVLEAHRDRLDRGVATMLERPAAFLDQHRGLTAHAVLHKAHDEQARRAAMAALPQVSDLGPAGRWVDHWARTVRAQGGSAGLALVRHATSDAPVPRGHLVAFLLASGGDLALDASFTPDEEAQGKALAATVQRLASCGPDGYEAALRGYLMEGGLGEDA